MKLISHIIISIILSIYITTVANAEYLAVPSDKISDIFKTEDAVYKIENDTVVYEINKRANILVLVQNISSISFDYSSDNYFKIGYAGYSQKGMQPYLFLYKNIDKTENGHININFLESAIWSPENPVLLMIEGTGTLKIKNIKIDYNNITSITDHKTDVFFMPENIRHTTINFLTPIFWDITKGEYWNNMIGMIALVGIVFIGVLINMKKTEKKYLVMFILVMLMIYNAHFLYSLRDIYAKDLSNVIISRVDKLRYNSMDRLLGELLAKSSEIIKNGDTVLVYTYDGDWFHRQNICFNILPNKCVYELDKPSGIGGYYQANIKDIDFIITYNYDKDIDSSFKPLFKVNEDVAIYGRK